jgi:hypothetical protein
VKKALIGCAVVMLVGGIATFAGGYWIAKEMAGEMTEAMRLAGSLSIDRLDQEALDVAPEQLAAKLAEVNNKPVRLMGRIMDMGGGLPQPPNQEQTAGLFMEPAILVLGTDPMSFPKGARPGLQIRVLGIASRLKLGALPMDEEGRKAIQKQFAGSTDVPMVVARRVEVLPSPAR